MGKKSIITQYREKLDRTLASPDLTNRNTLKELVQNQLLHPSLADEIGGCSEKVIAKRTDELSHFLDMLRSASIGETSHGEWKIKEDNEEFRVMYRPGPEGTPLHTLLVEGYVDGTVDACLCISWQSALYKKWWPQYNFPPFKIENCNRLQKVRIGEQISIVRVKVTWPLSTREAVVHFFLFEYFQDDLIIVLINSVSDSEDIAIDTHGFTKDGIPGAKDVVRIDLVGGFAIQKMTPERSYFRTIANMDIKIDFVPPSFINFISRQLIGSGVRLYQKTVGSVSFNDADFGKALRDPMFSRIREALYGNHEQKVSVTVDRKRTTGDSIVVQDHAIQATQTKPVDMELSVIQNGRKSEYLAENPLQTENRASNEIEEEKDEESSHLKNEICIAEEERNGNNHEINVVKNSALASDQKSFGGIDEGDIDDDRSSEMENDSEEISVPATSKLTRKNFVDSKGHITVSPEVEKALETLDKAILVVRKYGFKPLARSLSELHNEVTSKTEKELEKEPEKESVVLNGDKLCSSTEVSAEEPQKGRTTERTSHESWNSSSNGDIRRIGSNSLNHKKIAPTSSPEQYLPCPTEDILLSSASLSNENMEVSVTDFNTQEAKLMNLDVNGINENASGGRKKRGTRRMQRFCCLVANSRGERQDES